MGYKSKATHCVRGHKRTEATWYVSSKGKGYCRECKNQRYRGEVRPTTTLDRFLAKIKIDPNTGCWMWTAGQTEHGYAQFRHKDHGGLGHRFAYIHFRGVPPKGTELDHLCRTPLCCNPAHLEAVSHQVNVSRGLSGARSHCPSGHPYAGTNILLQKNGKRVCRECNRLRCLAYNRRIAAKKRLVKK